MTPIEIPLNGFVDYLRTHGAARVDVAARHIAQAREPYNPARDFYRRILAALLAGRRGGDDRAVCEHALTQAPPTRRAHYQAVVDGWLRLLPHLEDTTPERVHTGRWRSDGVNVKVTPHFAARFGDGQAEAYLLYLKAEPLAPGDAAAMLWLAEAVMEQVCPRASAVVVDVRRARMFRQRPTASSYLAWLSAEAGGYRQLRQHLDTAA